jgi:hypothetical protein
MKICKKCNIKFSTRVNIEGKFRNLINRKFCLNCSPFLQHNTRDISKYSFTIKDNLKFCIGCKENKLKDNFYKNKSSYCKKCFLERCNIGI